MTKSIHGLNENLISKQSIYDSTTFTFLVGEDLHLAAKHGLEQCVLSREHLHSGIVERSSHVQANVFAPCDIALAAGLNLGTFGGRDGENGVSPRPERVQAALSRHVPLQVDDHPAHGRFDVTRRGERRWGSCQCELSHIAINTSRGRLTLFFTFTE